MQMINEDKEMTVSWYTLYAFVVGRSVRDGEMTTEYHFHSYVVLPQPNRRTNAD
jgi:hypothetical protein